MGNIRPRLSPHSPHHRNTRLGLGFLGFALWALASMSLFLHHWLFPFRLQSFSFDLASCALITSHILMSCLFFLVDDY